MRCYKCSKFDSGYVKILDVTEVKVECSGKVLNVEVMKGNRGRASSRDHQDYEGKCRIILMGYGSRVSGVISTWVSYYYIYE